MTFSVLNLMCSFVLSKNSLSCRVPLVNRRTLTLHTNTSDSTCCYKTERGTNFSLSSYFGFWMCYQTSPTLFQASEPPCRIPQAVKAQMVEGKRKHTTEGEIDYFFLFYHFLLLELLPKTQSLLPSLFQQMFKEQTHRCLETGGYKSLLS